jgi:hypothetical protein
LVDETGKRWQARLQHHQRPSGKHPNCSQLSGAVAAAALLGVGKRVVRMAEAGRQEEATDHMRPAATPFALAGVYDVWKGANGQAITSFAIVTTDAAPSVAQYYDRMPVVLDDGQFDDWMRGTPDQAASMMRPYARDIEAWEVGPEVGNVRNNRPELMERVGLL